MLRSTTRIFTRNLAGSLRALPTRKQAFKAHLVALREKDPERWTPRTLAFHFRLPLANVEAMLALQQLEAEAKSAKGALNPQLVSLAEDAGCGAATKHSAANCGTPNDETPVSTSSSP